MALKDIKIPTADVVVSPDSVFAVRGLSTLDIEHLVRVHGPDLRVIWDRYVGSDVKNVKLSDIGAILKDVVVQAPLVVAGVIGLAADADAEDMVALAKLPIHVQIAALSTVIGMTLSLEGDMGKAMETAIKLVSSMNSGLGAVLANMASPSPSTLGSGDSDVK